jgi:hypothetical protein
MPQLPAKPDALGAAALSRDGTRHPCGEQLLERVARGNELVVAAVPTY